MDSKHVAGHLISLRDSEPHAVVFVCAYSIPALTPVIRSTTEAREGLYGPLSSLLTTQLDFLTCLHLGVPTPTCA